MFDSMLKYDLGEGAEAFSTERDASYPYQVILGNQIHGCKVAVIDNTDRDEAPDGCDALVTDLPGVAVGVRTADCVPILLYDSAKKVVAAVHAGWRGTVLNVARKAVNVMESRFGCRAVDMTAVMGPAIGPASFQVGEEVAMRFKEAGFPMQDIWKFCGHGDGSPMSGGHHIDLIKANRWLLEQAGVPAESIRDAGIDTYTNEAFFSARREGADCGRIITAIKLV